MDNFNVNHSLGRGNPLPLSPTRKIELVRTEVSISGPCCSSQCSGCIMGMRGLGKLTCSRCKAIKYCGQECQKTGWKEHKENCNTIKKLREETVAAGEALANEFGGTEVFLQTVLVKKGRFKYIDEPPTNNPNEKYILARVRLTEAYAKCGMEALSCAAFRLAAENMLDLLCLTYSERTYSNPTGMDVSPHKIMLRRFCGWMVAGGMDQEAINYICYFQYCRLSPLPYLDLSKDEDIEGDSYLQMLKKPTNDLSTWDWFQDFMLIALVKYKRLQALMIQRQKEKAIWRTFMMGTHPRAGESSVILGIRGKTPVIWRLEDFLMDQKINSRIKLLTNQLKQILTDVNEKNSLMIPAILDPRSIPEKPLLQERDEEEDFAFDEDDELDGHSGDIHDATWGFNYYGHAWNMSSSYRRVLQLFLDFGNITMSRKYNEVKEKNIGDLVKGKLNTDSCSIPVEGFLRAAFDTDPTRCFFEKDDLSVQIEKDDLSVNGIY